MRKFVIPALLVATVATLDAATRITISPTSATVNTGSSVSFSAKVVGGKKVQWRATCGVIDSKGVYTAPAVSETCQVTALSGTAVSNAAVVNVVAPVTPPPPPPPPPAPTPAPAPTATGTVISVQAGAGVLETVLLQAFTAAQTAPVTVVLGAGDYPGNFVFPRSSAIYPITFTADPATLPAAGTRMDPSYTGRLPRLVPLYLGSATLTVQGDGYIFRGLQVESPGVGVTTIDVLGQTVGDFPRDITFDQMLIRGNQATGGHRGVGMNGVNVTVTNSWIDRMWEVDRDAQAVAAWDTPGPLRVENNYLEASGEDLLLGGSIPTCGCAPTGVLVTRNYFTKNVAWKTMSPSPSIKNILEVKFGRQVTITNNIFEHNWQQAQTGWSILFTTMGVPGTAWTTVEDVLFSGNIVRDVSSGVNVAAVTEAVKRVRIENNVWQHLDYVTWGGDGRWAMVQTGTTGIEDLTIDHNTVIGISGNQFLDLDGSVPVVRLTMTHNVVEHRDYGIHSSSGLAVDALNAMAPGYVFVNNAIVGPAAYWLTWPAGNFDVDVAVADQFDSQFAIKVGSPLQGLPTSDGAPVGANPSVLPR